MLEFIRKYQYGIMLIVAIIVVIAFTFIDNPNRSQNGNRADGMTVGGEHYSQRKINELGQSFQLSQMLGMQQLPMLLSQFDRRTAPQARDQAGSDFIMNLAVLRESEDDLGISPSDAQLIEERDGLFIFQNEEGQFDPAKKDLIIENLEARGISKVDVLNTVEDSVALENLISLVSASIKPSPTEVDLLYTRRWEEMAAKAFYFDRADYVEGVGASAEEIAAYFEENKATLLSEQERKIDYVFMESPTGLDQVSAEERIEVKKKHDDLVYEFSAAVVEDEALDAAGFKEIADAYGLEVLSSDAFPPSAPPVAFAANPELVRQVFARPEENPVSDPITNEAGTYVFLLAEVIAPRPLTLEEASPKITGLLTDQKVEEALVAAAEAARGKLEASLAAGKDIAAAAAEAGLTPTDFGGFSIGSPPVEGRSARGVLRAAADLAAGAVSPVTPDAEGALFIHLASRGLVEGPESAQRRQQILDEITSNEAYILTDAWFRRAKEDAGL